MLVLIGLGVVDRGTSRARLQILERAYVGIHIFSATFKGFHMKISDFEFEFLDLSVTGSARRRILHARP
jgi:hypothetical protein